MIIYLGCMRIDDDALSDNKTADDDTLSDDDSESDDYDV